jgi:hypothetical protein
MRRFRLQRFAEEPEVEVDVTIKPPADDAPPAPAPAPAPSDAMASMIFVQEQINEMRAELEAARVAITEEQQGRWMEADRRWEMYAELSARMDTLEGGGDIDDDEGETEGVETVIEGSEEGAGEDTEGVAAGSDSEPDPEPDPEPVKRRPGLLF